MAKFRRSFKKRRSARSVGRRFKRAFSRKRYAVKRKRTSSKGSARWANKVLAKKSPYAAIKKMDTGLVVPYAMQVTVADFQMPSGFANPGSTLVEAQYYFGNTTLFNSQPYDTLLNEYCKMYTEFRLKCFWVEIYPKFTTVYPTTTNRMGEIFIVPLHEQEYIYRSGQTTIPFSGTYPSMYVTDIDYWMRVPHAKRFKVGSREMKMKIMASSFDYNVEGPQIGTASAVTYGLSKPKYGVWLPTQDFADTTVPSVNQTQYFGFAVIWAGWQTDANTVLDWGIRVTYGFEFRKIAVKTGIPQMDKLAYDPMVILKPPMETKMQGLEIDDGYVSDAPTVIVDPPYPRRLPSHQLQSQPQPMPQILKRAVAK
nr:MAG: capsid protein [Cressdnaviricota sp.]